MKKNFSNERNSKMNIFIVYAHPSDNSFTFQVKKSFVEGLKSAGHNVEVSDLYKMNFNPVMSEKEYLREAFYKQDAEVPLDVIEEQKKIENADVIAFIYPVLWTAAPAIMEGWFQRVWTYGYAYGEERKMKTLDKAIFLVTMGGSLKDKIRQIEVAAMETVMIDDRMKNRSKENEFYVFDEMTRGYSNDLHREENIKLFTKKACELGKNI